MSATNYFNEFLLLYVLSGLLELLAVGVPFFVAGFVYSRWRRQRQQRAAHWPIPRKHWL